MAHVSETTMSGIRATATATTGIGEKLGAGIVDAGAAFATKAVGQKVIP